MEELLQLYWAPELLKRTLKAQQALCLYEKRQAHLAHNSGVEFHSKIAIWSRLSLGRV